MSDRGRRPPLQLATGRNRRIPRPPELAPRDRLDAWKDEARQLLASVQVDVDLFPEEVEHFLKWLQVEAEGERLR